MRGWCSRGPILGIGGRKKKSYSFFSFYIHLADITPMKDLDPAALDCLAALADHGHFARAAQQLSITQSAVSQRLRTLESQAGQPLVIRSRPLRLTAAGKVLLRFARQLQAMRTDLAIELGETPALAQRLPIAVNADSLGTWVIPALDELVQRGLPIELVVDDQEFTHDWLRDGEVLGCVSTMRTPLRGCRAVPLGEMAYVAVASPGFVADKLPGGVTRSNFTQLPFLVFNRKDRMHATWVSRACGVRQPRLREVFVPAAEPYVDAALRGWGIGIAPEIQVRPHVAAGRLVVLRPDVELNLRLFWHQWQLGAADGETASPGASLDQVGTALVIGARRAGLTR
jgi:LysR family transcriptional regulator (chromosome initiation inhibitor)